MNKFLVRGNRKLKGKFTPAGNKNEALAVLAASLLTKNQVVLNNLPEIGDVVSMLEIIKDLGVEVDKKNNSVKINAKTIDKSTPHPDFAKKIRGSFLLISPILIRLGKVEIAIPGGDSIGKRRLDTHFQILKKLGAVVSDEGKSYSISCSKLKGADIFLDEASVMATENAIMACSLSKGTSTIYNAACEPHVQGLCRMLNKMGAKISGIGSNLLKIEGVQSLGAVNHLIQMDHIEIGSIIGLAAVTKSEISIAGAKNCDLGLIDQAYFKLGVDFKVKDDLIIVPAEQELTIRRDNKLRIPKIDDAPWPGFPSDLLSIMIVVATQAKGTVLFFEKLFESRLFWVDKLILMGAEIVLCDPHRVIVNGPTKLTAERIASPDIRAGMALLIAAMAADGVSEIQNIEQIDRGYAQIDQKLQALGADIKRESD